MKSNTVSFGQPVPEDRIREAEDRCGGCDLFLAMGSSLSVYPAARLPLTAKQNGAALIILNLTPTTQDQHADIINGLIGEILPKIIAKIKVKLN
jgi:NAD-dependent deacetylase